MSYFTMPTDTIGLVLPKKQSRIFFFPGGQSVPINHIKISVPAIHVPAIHKDGTPFNETEKLQVKWLQNELRQKLGIDIHWQKDKNGIVRGYGIVDHKTKTAFDGSQVLRMAEWMELQRKENEEKGQKVIGSLGQNRPRLTNVDSIYIAKHKNGKYYLRVILNNYGRSEIFFLSKEETRAYLLAADAMERERLKQQFAFKYLLRASGGSYDQNREWEVGNGYDGDDGRGLKR